MLIHVARGFVVESSGFSLRLETIHVTACAGPCHDTVSPSVYFFYRFYFQMVTRALCPESWQLCQVVEEVSPSRHLWVSEVVKQVAS